MSFVGSGPAPELFGIHNNLNKTPEYTPVVDPEPQPEVEPPQFVEPTIVDDTAAAMTAEVLATAVSLPLATLPDEDLQAHAKRCGVEAVYTPTGAFSRKKTLAAFAAAGITELSL